MSIGDLPEKSDVIFVFGNYKIPIAEHAAELFVDGWAPQILISGYKSKLLPESEIDEAEYYKKICVSKGVPENSIILEKKASNLLENVLFGMTTLNEQGINPKKIILCAHATGLMRARATFNKQFPDIKTVCPPHKIAEDFWTENRLKRLMGEFYRLHEYADKGDIAKTEIPEDIQKIIKKVKENNNL